VKSSTACLDKIGTIKQEETNIKGKGASALKLKQRLMGGERQKIKTRIMHNNPSHYFQMWGPYSSISV